ncbi:hypothetical protein EDD11_007426 [Mortierella claussenii]|nr:hypothetical protein EDD11_007426 [Mortierella claussenii]
MNSYSTGEHETSDNKNNNHGNQPWLQSNITEEPNAMADPLSFSERLQEDCMMDMAPTDTSLFGGQASTFGLSDDDLMSSFTTFTARLGDSLMARSPGAIKNHDQQLQQRAGLVSYDGHGNSALKRPKMQLQTSVPSLSPSSLERSPTTSSESLSPSLWMPWTSLDQGLMGSSNINNIQTQSHPLQQQQQQQPFFGVPPTTQHNGAAMINLQQVYPDISSQMAYPQNLFIAQPDGVDGLPYPTNAKLQMQQSETWNQYMQYLLYQQGLTPSDPTQQQQFSQERACPQNPHQQPQLQMVQPQQQQQQYQQGAVDPHWQATMMAMMMDHTSHMDGVSLDRAL